MQVREGHAGHAVAHVVVHRHYFTRLPSGAGQAHIQRDRLRSQGVAWRLGDLGLVMEKVAGSAQGFQTHGYVLAEATAPHRGGFQEAKVVWGHRRGDKHLLLHLDLLRPALLVYLAAHDSLEIVHRPGTSKDT